jgi:hypothetical protein
MMVEVEMNQLLIAPERFNTRVKSSVLSRIMVMRSQSAQLTSTHHSTTNERKNRKLLGLYDGASLLGFSIGDVA